MGAALRDISPGTVIGGDYRVIEALREGGMGAVYVVEQLSTGSKRALKVMHPSIAGSASARERFRTEARAGALIESDHVVQVIGAGFDEALGLPWLVMELLTGRDLSEELQQRGRISSVELASIFRELCHALAAAHRVGIVHRDLKPENIFLAAAKRASADYTVKVLDFGIAKIMAEAQSSNTGAIGTPLYMAPEQTVAGEAIGPFTDVWALGLIAYRLLTGTSFWKTARAANPSTMSMLREVAMDPIPSASERAREHGVAEYLPHGFDAWFGRCLERQVDRRYQNANEVLKGLLALLGIEELGAERPTIGDTGGILAGVDPPKRRANAPATDQAEAGEELPPLAGVKPGPNLLLWAGASAVTLAGLLFMASRGATDAEPDAQATSDRVQCPRDTAHIVGGEFSLGDTNRRVNVKDICMDLDEVSWGEYAACVRAGHCSAQARECMEESEPMDPQVPITCVSFQQAETFCKARDMRLPTEEEWEWVGRRGTEATAYPWGNDPPSEQLCWSGVIKRDGPCPLGKFTSGDTPEHVRDLAGNVSEWTSSIDRAGRRVIRGSSWAEEEPKLVRSAERSTVGATHHHAQLGMRCVKEVPVQRPAE